MKRAQAETADVRTRRCRSRSLIAVVRSGLLALAAMAGLASPASAGDGSLANPFTHLGEASSAPVSGRYYFDLGSGVFQADVDTSEGGGWVLILQYLHAASTTPSLSVLGAGADLPVTSTAPLGTDESAITTQWGHAGNAAVAQFTGDFETRWYGEISIHSRVMHFRSTVGDDYMRTGTGSFNGIQTDFTTLTGHTANLPAAINSFRSNSGDTALTNFPYFSTNLYHWALDGSLPVHRWEVDDNSGGGGLSSTIHRVWIRAIDVDRSDAPASYGEATHIFTPGIQLGAAIDVDPAPFASANSDADGADDDGLGTLTFPTLVPNQTYNIPVAVTGAGGRLQAWIDFNRNGAFEAGEQIVTDAADNVPPEDQGSRVNEILTDFTVPAGAVAGPTVARFRWSTEQGIGPNGPAADGEVEDYAVTIAPVPPPPPVPSPPASGPGSAAEPFTHLGDARTVSASGRYVFDLGSGAFEADVDTAEGGGWVLILQYLHAATTTPSLSVLGAGADLPVTSSGSLGDDESTFTTQWGHAGNAAAAQFTGDFETRWYGETSNHNRILHFRSTVGDDYMRTGMGSFSGIESGFTVLTGHDANLPAAINDFRSNSGDTALTNFPYFSVNANHWALDGSFPIHRWEVDDFTEEGGGVSSTIHRVWVRSVDVDRSDGPASYGEAEHGFAPSIRMGAAVDLDPVAIASANSDADGADDDGLGTLTFPTLVPNQTYNIPVAVTGAGGRLQAWIDFNGNDAFDAGEQIATNVQDNVGPQDLNPVDDVIVIEFTVPAGAVAGPTVARFRWSTEQSIGPSGLAADGEVEDYAVTVAPVPIAPPVPSPPASGPGSAAEPFTHLGEAYSVPASGRYVFDLGSGAFEADVDTSEGGGWVLILQYLHRKATVPGRTVIGAGADLPVTSSGSLGDDESTFTTQWGHAGNAAMAQFTGDFETRWYGETSTHSRIMHFRSSVGDDYMRTGTGSFSGTGSAFTALSGHSANLPNAPGTNFGAGLGDQAITDFPFFVNEALHWSIVGNDVNRPDRWEVDEAPAAYGGPDTLHRMWVRQADVDRSDAPASYGEATHVLQSGIQLGAAIDADPTPIASANSDADGADDDGLGTLTFPTLFPNQTYNIPVAVTGVGGRLQAWIDFNGNGAFEAGEQIVADAADNVAPEDQGSEVGEILIEFTVPAGAVAGPTVARFRWSTEQGIGPSGPAADGEVEDYAVTIAPVPTPPPVPSPPPSGPGSAAEPFTHLAEAYSVPASGRYVFDLGSGAFEADVDTAEGGGWVLILQYLHADATTPSLSVLGAGADLPVTSSGSLGDDESTFTTQWGHAGNAAMAQFTGDFETRWYGEISNHNRILHFRSTVGDDYMRTGTGSFNGIQTDFTALTGHTANLPAATSSFRSDSGDTALTNFPYFAVNLHHWALDGSLPPHRWEVDNNSGGGGASSTIHRVWVRSVDVDRSDAPASYDEATHIYVPTVALGAAVDVDPVAIPSANADADGADDDGIAPLELAIGFTTVVPVTVQGTGGYLQAWIDFNGDDDFTGSGEQVVIDVQDNGPGDADPTVGVMAVSIPVPSGVTLASSFARLRWSTASGLGPGGAAPDGEVEDYLVSFIRPDYGDAPNIPTGQADGRHAIPDTPTYYLGAVAPDSDADAQPSGAANGDDADGNDDEDLDTLIVDGTVGFEDLPTIAGGPFSFDVAVTEPSAGAGYLSAWVDTNGDGTFDAQIATDLRDNGAGGDAAAGDGHINVAGASFPGSAHGTSYAVRFRFCSTAGDCDDPTEQAADGELEDHLITTAQLDYGDAPQASGYPTALAQNGARHAINPTQLVQIGSVATDGEDGASATGDPAATVDDLDGVNDEDGGDTLPAEFSQSQSFSFSLSIVGSGYLNAWVDWNANGNFSDPGEQIFVDQAVFTGSNPFSGTTPAVTTIGNTYMRLRVCAEIGHCDAPTGIANSGEVEDHLISIRQSEMVVRGSVFEDTGSGVPGNVEAHDGVFQTSTETRLTGVTVEAFDTVLGQIVATDTTDGNGSYELVIPDSSAGNSVMIRTALESAQWLHVSDFSSTFQGSDPIPPGFNGSDGAEDENRVDGQLSIVPVLGMILEGVDFGQIARPTLSASQSIPTLPGDTETFAHSYTASSNGDVFLTTFVVSETPNASAFTDISVFIDNNADGAFDAGDTSVTGPVAVVAGEVLRLLTRVQTSGGAPQGAQLIFELVAFTDFNQVTVDIDPYRANGSAASCAALVSSLPGGFDADHCATQSNDLSVAAPVALNLTKSVCNDTAGSTEFGPYNSGSPGDVLVYRLTVLNPTVNPAIDVSVYDSTPLFTSAFGSVPASDPNAPTSLQPAPVNCPGGGQSTVPGTLNCTMAAPTAGNVGSIQWECTGQFGPGALAEFYFQVRIDP